MLQVVSASLSATSPTLEGEKGKHNMATAVALQTVCLQPHLTQQHWEDVNVFIHSWFVCMGMAAEHLGCLSLDSIFIRVIL